MSTPHLQCRLLVVDPDRAVRDHLQHALQQYADTFQTELASDGPRACAMVRDAHLANHPYALAVVSLNLSGENDGIDSLQKIWQIDPDIQTILCISGTDCAQTLLQRVGASGRLAILRRPVDPLEISQIVLALWEKWRLRRQAAAKIAEFQSNLLPQEPALVDPLTGLANRSALRILLKKATARAAANPDAQFAILAVDFGRFKLFNDGLGHDFGDELLVSIARKLHSLIDPVSMETLPESGAVAARTGGHQFVILQFGVASADAPRILAEKLLSLLALPHQLGSREVFLTASIGIAVSDHQTAPARVLLRDAENAMDWTKAQGRAAYAFFMPEMHSDALSRLTLESDLRHALNNGQLQMWYQPIVSIADGGLMGFEALVRWQHPERGIISPGDFIPVAEESGIIVELGAWVIEESARQLGEWSRVIPAARALHVSVNCSRKQLSDPQLIAHLSAALSRNNLAPHRINLEITESIVMEQLQSATAVLNTIRNSGMHVHMDDFGTGYSSLYCLHGLPVNVLKVDRSFINNMSQRRDYAAVINAIIQLAHNLGMEVIAEGVETADQVAMLSSLDCDWGQGYYFSKPLPPEQAGEYIKKAMGAHQLV